jgi:transposase InsO family protein
MLGCQESCIEQKFTRPKTPRTNGKAERVIKTLMEIWHNKTS